MTILLRRSKPAGFTLVEILAALGVLAVGLSAVVALVLGSSKASVVAADRNTATIFLSEAIENIERLHLITPETVQSLPGAHTEDIGLFIETVDNVARGEPTWPSIHGDYNPLYAGAFPLAKCINDPYSDTMIWPPSDFSPRYNGPLTTGGSGNAGTPYRVIYHIERHPDWVAALNSTPPETSPYEGVYVLTLAPYRDLNPDVLLQNQTSLKRYEQISEPTIVYLRARNKN